MTQDISGDRRSSSMIFQRRIFLVRRLLRGAATAVELIADARAAFDTDIYPPDTRAALRHDLAALRVEFGCEIQYNIRDGYTLKNVGSFAALGLSTEDEVTSSSSDVITMNFDFPEAVSTPCKQYLLYFVDFLRDIGIEATANFREEAGQLLFSVTPKDKEEALDNIREALGVYLDLPTKQIVISTMSPETSIEVQQLGSQVLHLQSQIMLGNAMVQQQQLALQLKDNIIDQLQTFAQQQQQMITARVLLDSVQTDKGQDDTESLGTDLVKLKTWEPEHIPVKVDLPKILRYYKEKFSRKKLP